MADKAARTAVAARITKAFTEAVVQERATVLKELDNLKNTASKWMTAMRCGGS